MQKRKRTWSQGDLNQQRKKRYAKMQKKNAMHVND